MAVYRESAARLLWRRAPRLMLRWHRRTVRVVTFFYELPDPLPFPDGSTFSFQLDEELPALARTALRPIRELPPIPWQPGHSFVSLRFWRTSVGPPEFESLHDPVAEAIRKALPARFHPRASSEVPAEGLCDRFRGWWPRRRYAGGLEGESYEPPVSYRTIVEAVTVVDFGRGERALSDAFDNCLAKVSELVRAYRNYSHDPIRHVTRQRLPPFALFITRTLNEPPKWADGLSLMLLHMNVPGVAVDELEQSELDQFRAHLSVILRGHPLAVFTERAIDARVAFDREGDYGEAIVQTQISCEVLLDGLLTLMLWEEGMGPEGAAVLFQEGLTKRVRSHYAARLGGNWDPKTSAPLAAWMSKVTYVRGRVVHAAYRPSIDEAREARNAAEQLEDFVQQRVVARRTRYPRTTLLTLGRPGLERLGLWAGQIERFAEQADDEPDWLKGYSSWREAFEAARVMP